MVYDLNIELHVYDDTVVVLYGAYTLKWVSIGGRHYEKRRQVTSTRVKRQGRWQIVNAHFSDVPR